MLVFPLRLAAVLARDRESFLQELLRLTSTGTTSNVALGGVTFSRIAFGVVFSFKLCESGSEPSDLGEPFGRAVWCFLWEPALEDRVLVSAHLRALLLLGLVEGVERVLEEFALAIGAPPDVPVVRLGESLEPFHVGHLSGVLSRSRFTG